MSYTVAVIEPFGINVNRPPGAAGTPPGELTPARPTPSSVTSSTIPEPSTKDGSLGWQRIRTRELVVLLVFRTSRVARTGLDRVYFVWSTRVLRNGAEQITFAVA